MTTRAEELTKLRRAEQDVRGYAASSRWYTGLSNAICYLELAETSSSDKDKFLNAWSVINNLFMMIHARGSTENDSLMKWIEEIKTSSTIRARCHQISVDFLKSVLAAQNSLLRDAEKNIWRESKNLVEIWLQKCQKSPQSLSPEKACNYTFILGRDIRNAVSHPNNLNPSAKNVKKAFEIVAQTYTDIAYDAIKAIIEHPPEKTTGRTTAYRSVLYPFLKNSDSFFSDYYLERLFPETELINFAEDITKEKLKQIDKQLQLHRSTLINANQYITQQLWHEPVLFTALDATVYQGVRIIAEDAIFEPSYVITHNNETPQAEYQGKETKSNIACLIWALPWRNSLDEVLTHPDFGDLPVMEVVQRALNRSDVSWAILTNGKQLRLLNKTTSHKPRCFLEVDLAAIIADYKADIDARFAFRYLLGLFSGTSFTKIDEKEQTLLDRVVAGSERHGQDISEKLKQNVFNALATIGDGFLDYIRNHPNELEIWHQKKYPSITHLSWDSNEVLTDVYQESLILMYRLLFLFYAESRDDLLPMENETYREVYSLESIRDEIIAVKDDADKTKFYSIGDTQLWQKLQQLFCLINEGQISLAIPAYNGGLFDQELHQFLEIFQIGDYYLAKTIDLLSRTSANQNRSKGRPKGEGRKKVTYRDLDIRHLGSIYEGILEYSARTAEEDLVVIKRGTSGKTYEEYVSVSDLKAEEMQQLQTYRQAEEEDQDNLLLPRNCKILGFKPKGSYFLVYGGRESKRKSSGSYYTPDYIVQYIVENTLSPLVRGENRGGDLQNVPLTADEILELKTLDPAMGSGHFLVAATEFLARAYGDALIKENKVPDKKITDAEFIRYKRIVAERCIYGVDLNPMAVELAKLSMWLFTMDRNRPLSFLNHHLKCGNSLIGAWIDNLAQLPDFDKKGKPKPKQRELSYKQINLYEEQFKARVPTMVSDTFGIMKQETLTVEDVQLKKDLNSAIEQMKKPFKNIADMWVATFFGERDSSYYRLLTDVEQSRNHQSNTANKYNFFHYELAFPEVFFNQNGQNLDNSGFNVIIGNPPYVDIKSLSSVEVQYIFSNYSSANNRIDLFSIFIEQALLLVNSSKFRLSMIVPTAIMTQASYLPLRRKILNNYHISKLVRLPNESFGAVAGEVKVDTVIFVLGEHNHKIQNHTVEVVAYEGYERISEIDASKAPISDCIQQIDWASSNDSIWSINANSSHKSLLEKVEYNSIILEKCADISLGITPYDKYKGHTPQQIENQVFHANSQKDHTFKKLLAGNDVCRYLVAWNGKQWISYGSWLGAPREQRFFTEERIIIKQIIDWTTKRIWASLTSEELYNTQNAFNLIAKSDWNNYYLLGIINSKLITFYHRKKYLDEFKMRFQKILIKDCRRFPIHKINLLEQTEKYQHDQIVASVEQMLSLHQQLAVASKQKKASLQKQIDAIDKHIDQLVYQLYGLTYDEVAIVEAEIK